MTVGCSWEYRPDGGLATILGPLQLLVEPLQDLSGKVNTLVEALNVVKTTVGIVDQFVTMVGDIGLATLLRPIVEDVRNRIRDIRKTGIYMLPIGFKANVGLGGAQIEWPGSPLDIGIDGGLGGLKNALRLAFLDERDPCWPALSDSAGVAGTLFVAFGLDATAIQTVRDLLKKGFMSDQMLNACQDMETFWNGMSADGLDKAFKDGFNRYRIQETARYGTTGVWSSLSLERVLPDEFSTFLIRIEAALNGLLAMLVRIQLLKQFLAVLTATIERIEAILAIVQSVLAFLQLLLVRFPVAMMTFGPSTGGMRGMADSLDSWFDAAAHPEIDDVPSNSKILAVLFLLGCPTLEDMDENLIILNQVMQFGQSVEWPEMP